jgi:hypothetical protein
VHNTRSWKQIFNQPPPRCIPAAVEGAVLSGSRQWGWVVAGATVACVLGFALIFPVTLYETLRLDLKGASGWGEVTRSEYATRAVGTHAFMRRQKLYLTSFGYADQQGDWQQATCYTVGPVALNKRVSVEYLPGESSIARIDGGFFVPGGYWAGLWSFLFVVLAFFGIWNFRVWHRRRLRLLHYGVLGQGVIEQLWTDGSPNDGGGWAAIHFDADDRLVQITENLNSAGIRIARNIAKARGHLSILYDARSPRECIVLDLLPPPQSQSG